MKPKMRVHKIFVITFFVTLIFSLSTLLCLSQAIFAQPVAHKNKSSFSENITINEILAYGLKHNPSLAVAKQQLLSTQYEHDNSLLNAMPSLLAKTNISYNDTNTADSSVQPSIGLSLSMPVYHGGQLSDEKDIAKNRLQQAAYKLLRLKQKTIKEIKNAFIDVIHSQAIYELDKMTLLRLKEHGRISNTFFNEAQVWKNDVLQAEVKIAQGEKDLIASENQINRKKSALNELLGREIDDELNINSAMNWYEFDLPGQKAADLLSDNHPDVLQAKLDYQIAQLKISSLESSLKPQLDFSMNANAQREVLHNSSINQDYSLGLSMTYQLWDAGKTNNSIAQAKTQYIQLLHELFIKEQQVKIAIKNALLTVKESKQQLAVLEQAQNSAEENYKVNTIRYQEQLGTASDLLDAQELLSGAKKDRLNALANYLKAIENLHYEMAYEKEDLTQGIIRVFSPKPMVIENHSKSHKEISTTTIKQVDKVISNNTHVKNSVLSKENSKNKVLNHHLPKQGYSIQLIGLSHKKQIQKLYSQHKNITGLSWYQTQRNNQPWYILIYSSFKNKSDAIKSYERLPSTLKLNKPWIRLNSNIRF